MKSALVSMLVAASTVFLGCAGERNCDDVWDLSISNGPYGNGSPGRSLCGQFSSPTFIAELRDGTWGDLQFSLFNSEDRADEPLAVGDYRCSESRVHVTLNYVGDADTSGYTYSHFEAGQPPGPLSMMEGSDCTVSLSSAPDSGTVTGSFQGKLARQLINGFDYEYMDVSFSFSTEAP